MYGSTLNAGMITLTVGMPHPFRMTWRKSRARSSRMAAARARSPRRAPPRTRRSPCLARWKRSAATARLVADRECRIGERPLDGGDRIVDFARRLGHFREQRDVIAMDVGEFDQLRDVNPDDRPIEQQVFEPAGAVVGDHHVGRGQKRADVGRGGQVRVRTREHRPQPRHPVDPAGVLRPQVARAIVQLDDQVDRQLPAAVRSAPRRSGSATKPATRSARRGPSGGPDRGRATRSTASRSKRTVDQAIDLRHPDQPDRRAVCVDARRP